MAVTPSSASPCFAKGIGWPERPAILDRMEVEELADSVVARAITVLVSDDGAQEVVLTKTVSKDDPGLRWQTSETPPWAFPQRKRAEAREANKGGGS